MIEVSVKGKWVRVPACEIDGVNIAILGRTIRTAVIEAEEWLADELKDPGKSIQKLRENRRIGLHADIFTFAQKPTSPSPKYDYSMEWESIAVAPTSNYEEWWTGLPQESRKNVRRAQKRGVIMKVKSLDDELV